MYKLVCLVVEFLLYWVNNTQRISLYCYFVNVHNAELTKIGLNLENKLFVKLTLSKNDKKLLSFFKYLKMTIIFRKIRVTLDI